MQFFNYDSTLKISRVAGMLFLLNLTVPTLNWMYILSRFIPTEGRASMNILNQELLFRFNIINGIITTVIILALALCLYIILRTVNQHMAIGAFTLRITEAVITATLTLVYFISLVVLKAAPHNTEIQKLINLLINNYIFFTAIPGIFFGLGMIIFSYLLLKSGYVPVILAAFGIISYFLVAIFDSLMVLLPGYAIKLPVQIIGSAPVCIFQIITGLWLLCKGIKLNIPPINTQCQPINL
jgi:hypothetical protein